MRLTVFLTRVGRRQKQYIRRRSCASGKECLASTTSLRYQSSSTDSNTNTITRRVSIQTYHSTANMRSCFVAGVAATFITQVVSENLGFSPVWSPFDERSIAKRDIDETCFSSVIDELAAPTPASALYDWIVTEVTDIYEPLGCTVTLPATLSDEYLDYYDEQITFFNELESKAGKIHTKCGADTFSITLTEECTSEQTVYFADSSDDVASSTVLDAIELPTDVIYIGDATHNSVFGFAAVLAIALGAVIAL